MRILSLLSLQTMMHPSQNNFCSMRQPEHRGKPRTCSTRRRVCAQYLTLTLPVCNRLVSCKRVCLPHVAYNVGRLHSFVTHTTRRCRYYVQEHVVQKQHVVGRRELADGMYQGAETVTGTTPDDGARTKLQEPNHHSLPLPSALSCASLPYCLPL